MKRYTVDAIMALNPCDRYPRERIVELWDGRESLSLREILALDIPAQDRVWVALQPGAIPSAGCSVVIERAVTRAIGLAMAQQPSPEWKSWAEKWLSGEDRTAHAAAYAAYAAEAAAYAAAAAAFYAAEAAAYAAYAAAEAAEAAEAEYKQQIADIIELCC
jgi:hypothetical protein